MPSARNRRLPNPYMTLEEYERLAGIILPMQSVDELLAVFPDFAEGWVDDPDEKRRVAETSFERMQKYPQDNLYGILARRCWLCGALKASLMNHTFTRFRICHSCNDRLDELRYSREDWNGLTLKGQDALVNIAYRENRIVDRWEVVGYELKRPRPKRD